MKNNLNQLVKATIALGKIEDNIQQIAVTENLILPQIRELAQH